MKEDYIFPQIARGVRGNVAQATARDSACTGQQHGIGAHWQLWMLASAGMTPAGSLRVATLFGGESIGSG